MASATGSDGMYQGQIGGDFQFSTTPWAGTLSFDAIGSWVKDAVSLSNFGGIEHTCLTAGNCFISVNNQLFDPNDVLKATLSNNIGLELLGKYKRDNGGSMAVTSMRG